MKRTLADYPELVTQWHPTKNGDLSPSDVSYGTDRRCWWKCDKAPDHEWDAVVSSRTITGAKCPFCSNQKACKSNCLSTTHPHLLKEWHTAKNGDLSPDALVYGSGLKVWWKCPVADDHEWIASINHRTGVGSGCPCCSGKKVVHSNCLAFINPEVAVQYNETKNEVSANKIYFSSEKKVWWICDKGHEWHSTVKSRVRNHTNCPYCANQKVCQDNCLAVTHPELALQWHPTKNGKITIYDIVVGSGRNVWWKCPVADDHEWEVAPVSRLNNDSGCPCCSGRKAVLSNSIVTTNTNILSEWDYENNKIKPSEITAGSGRKVAWRCSNGHKWEASMSSRISGGRLGEGNGCPYCSRKRVCISNCLAVTHPDIAAQWHATKNGDFTPERILSGSKDVAWWKCPVADDHEWEASILGRCHIGSTNAYGCPFCNKRAASISNCLTTVSPVLASQWHPTKNGILTPCDVYAGGAKKYWWKCPVADDHEWEATINNRLNGGRDGNGTGCPCCTNHKVVLSNCLATIRPDLAVQWHPTKNGNLTPFDVTVCKKRAWWKCSVGHEWKSYIFSRVRDNRGCPACCESQGEKEVANILSEFGLAFNRQVTFKECKLLRMLPFDFGVNLNGGLHLIEYQGQHHYYPVSFGSKTHDVNTMFKLVKERDKIKRQFCKVQKIPLLEIPYWEDKIDESVIDFLGLKKVI